MNDFRFSIFDFRFSIFDFRFSIFDFRFSIFDRPLTPASRFVLLRKAPKRSVPPSSMNFHHHVPSPPLSHFISLLWFGDDYIVPHSLERVLPTGEISLIINLWENRTRVYDRDDPRKFTTCDGCIVAGAYSEFTVIDTDEQRATAGVVFRPGGALPFLGLPAAKLQDTGVSLADLWGRQAASELREQLLAARTPQQKFTILERTLLDRLNMSPEPAHPAV
jgi:hypothetical protein